MPKLHATIEWDEPQDPGWLNVFNLNIALRDSCPNTHFRITDQKSGVVCTDSWPQASEEDPNG